MYKCILKDLKNNLKPTAGLLEHLLNADELAWLNIFKQADEIRREYMGNTVHIRAIIEFSNYCRRKCAYCGLNSTNGKITRYRMQPEEIIATAIEGFKAGYRTVVLQSGEDPWYTPEILGDIVKEIKKNTDLSITLSCGEMSYDDYSYLRKCGADRYLLKHETADENIYSKLHSCGTLENRINCLKNLKKLGYETGSGFMIGLPWQTGETIARDILLLNSIPCDMAGIGPFIPNGNTPLRDYAAGSPLLTKKAVALARLVIKNIHLPATTALGVLDSAEKNDVFSCGANVVMRKITPPKYRELYKIYPIDLGEIKSIKDERIDLENAVRVLHRNPL